ncbi:hypothetical protein ACPTFE_13955, partial [Enterococcus faecalis]|uniref:hypothetical protein n=1 Tax=Enterococcus faecalis TaxID=1351 RepID=UPI003CC6BDFC
PELGALLSHNRNKFIEEGNQIIGGEVQLNHAYQGKDRIACRYCPFRSVCDFDVKLKENNYHRIENLCNVVILRRL